MRSYDRSPALLHTTFSDIRPVSVEGVQAGAFTANVERIKVVMNACITALHFRETGEKVQNWGIVLPNMQFDTPHTSGEQVQAWQQFLSLFAQMQWEARTTNSPEVFQYAVAPLGDGRVYSMRFYKAHLVFGIKAPEVSDTAGTDAE